MRSTVLSLALLGVFMLGVDGCQVRILSALGIAPVETAATLPSQRQPAERVTIQFQDGNFALLSRMPVEKRLPPSDALPDGLVSGSWYELQDPKGLVRYRRIGGDPIRMVFEGPDLGSKGTIPDRKEGIPSSRAFSLLIPAPELGDVVVIFGPPLELGTQGEPSGELGRIPFLPVIP